MRRVVTGLERWIDEGPPVAGLDGGCRFALLAHPASVLPDGRHAVELVRERASDRMLRLFAPEHGLFGEQQDMEVVGEAVDSTTGLEIVSLYGADETSLRPRAEHLAGIDAVVCDLQDVGSRYYTFVYTIAHVMEAARDHRLPVVILDRPNPLGGERVEGPVLDPAFASFVGRYPIPVRHGLTCGELARMFNEKFGIGCDLRVVTMKGWSRDLDFRATRLPWVPPSPNMPTLETVEVYPGGCLVEGTNLSEGRGTTTPFELVGAPWLHGKRLADTLRDSDLEGVHFRAAAFRPMFQKHAGLTCNGVQVIVGDRERFRPFRTYLALLSAARAQDPERFAWRREAYEFVRDRLAIDLLLGRADLRGAIEAGATTSEMERRWQDELAEFDQARRKLFLYD